MGRIEKSVSNYEFRFEDISKDFQAARDLMKSAMNNVEIVNQKVVENMNKIQEINVICDKRIGQEERNIKKLKDIECKVQTTSDLCDNLQGVTNTLSSEIKELRKYFEQTSLKLAEQNARLEQLKPVRPINDTIWQYIIQDKWHHFETSLNSELEQKYQNRHHFHRFADDKGDKYIIVFCKMRQYTTDCYGNITHYFCAVHRRVAENFKKEEK